MKRKETAERRKEKRDRRTEKETNERDQKKGITHRKMTEDVKYLFNLLANFGESFIEKKIFS